MQMFEWLFSKLDLTISSPEVISGNYNSVLASFGPQFGNASGNLIMADPIEACDILNNSAEILGNIVLIDRGNCFFDTKVDNAENAGAIAAIVCNNLPGGGVITMGGDGDPQVDIMSAMLSFEDCTLIKPHLPETIVNISSFTSSHTDSDLDNVIIAHEYGHGLSIRLTGGPSNVNCLVNAEQMGEGWSDFIGIILTMKESDTGPKTRGVGSYVLGQGLGGGGIRPYPYSTDLTINPHTYSDINSVSVPHGVGAVWCAMLWEMAWNLINSYGFDIDLYSGNGGNNIALQLVIEAMKLQPCDPGFIDGRNALLLADTLLYQGTYSCEIWSAFAKRGLGISAMQGDPDILNDGVEAFDIPGVCSPPPCTSVSLIYSNETIPNGTIELADQSIFLNGGILIDKDAMVSLKARNSIEIQAGLEVQTGSGSELLLQIGPCNPSNFNAQSDQLRKGKQDSFSSPMNK